MKLILIVGGILVLSSHFASAQNTYSSPYSIYGVGLINDRTSAFNRAMGGTGIAVQDEFNLNSINPASYGSIVSPISHIFETGFYLESNRYETTSLSESKTNGGLSNLNYWLKFSPRWSATVGLSPFSSVSYNIVTEREFSSDTQANYRYEGSGNINQLYFGNAFNVVKNLSVGVNVSYLFGSITRNESIETNVSEALTLENKVFTNKFDVDFGIQYRFNFKNKALIIGAVADDGVTFRGREKLTLYDGSADTLDHSSGERLTYKLPASLGAGLALQTRRSILAADLKFKQWSQADFEGQDVSLQDTWRYSFGYSYAGNPNAENYFGLVSLRTGFYVQDYHLKIKGNSFPSWGMSAGISLPVLDNKSSINLTYSYDQFGTTNDQLILQRSQKIMIDLVIRDLWGIRRKFD